MSLRALNLTTIALAALLLAACPGNSPVKTPAKVDSGSAPVYFDGGGYTPPAADSGVPLPAADGYVAPPPAADLGTGATGTMTCKQIFDCYNQCNDQACAEKCFLSGTATAQAQADAVEQCWYQAEAGVCKTQCANPQSQTCYTCEDQACAAQYAACGISF